MSRLIGTERYGSTYLSNSYALSTHDQRVEVVAAHRNYRFQSLSQFFRSVFLPQGYPESVSEDYLEYQIWDTIQAFSSSITGTLATQAVLKGVGVGDESATVLAATITWLVRDGMGMVGRIMFAWIQGSQLDCNCKRWRLFADVLNDTAIFLDILAPFFNSNFRAIICISGICRSIVGVAGGATRAALTQHQARRNNMADVSAKDGSQETLVHLLGLVCSLLLMPLVSGKQNIIWCLFIAGTMLHLYANYRAVVCVTMETFNQARLHLVVGRWLAHSRSTRSINVKEINLLEPVLWKTIRKFRLKVGCSLDKLVNRAVDFPHLISQYKNSRYLLSVNFQRADISIALHSESDWTDQLKACFHAEVIEYAFHLMHKKIHASGDKLLDGILSACHKLDAMSLITQSLRYVEHAWPAFKQALEDTGWKTTPVQLAADEWRGEWDLQGLESKKTLSSNSLGSKYFFNMANVMKNS